MGKRVLFVDDTESILFGYRRFCEKLFDDSWRFFFVNDGAEAIEVIESYEVDMVVSDLDMPFYDGVHLMDYIVEKKPSIIRVIVSGTTSLEKRQAVVKSAHQFFAKPAIPTALKDMFHRAMYLDTLLISNRARQFVLSLGALPALPAVFYELQAECENPDFSLQRCGAIVAKDVILSANILKLINSPFFDLPNRVKSPEQAVVLLGVQMIKALILQSFFSDEFASFTALPDTLEPQITRAFTFANLAKKIALRQGEPPQRQDTVYVTALLHNIGELIFTYMAPQKYQQVVEMAKLEGVPPCEVEQCFFSCSHADVGAYLLGLWGFEQEILECVVAHHNPSKGHRKSHDLLDYIFGTEYLLSCDTNTEEWVLASGRDYVQNRELLPKFKEWREFSLPL